MTYTQIRNQARGTHVLMKTLSPVDLDSFEQGLLEHFEIETRVSNNFKVLYTADSSSDELIFEVPEKTTHAIATCLGLYVLFFNFNDILPNAEELNNAKIYADIFLKEISL